MKKIFVLVLSLCVFSATFACPFCGCGVGGFYMGLLPNFKSGFVGVRYTYAHYSTHLTDQPDQFSKDYYHTAEVWGGISIGQKWQLLGFIPYHFNIQNTDDGVKKKEGLGDITLLANYKLWNSMKATHGGKVLRQEVWVGAGVKLPTGTYHVDLSDPSTELGDVNSQMGTGSTDFLANAMYNVHVGKWGVNTTANYKVSTANNSNFKYGNRFSANSFVYYTARMNEVFISPNAGILYEKATQNHLDSKAMDETGGYVTLASAGAEVNVGKLIVGASAQMPFAQDYAHGQTVAKTRCLVHVTVSL